MTILEVTAVPFGADFRGGGESYPWRLARALSKFERVISCYSNPAVPERRENTLLIPALFLDLPPAFRRENPLPSLTSVRAINRTLEQVDDLEFVHVHNLRTAMSTAWLIQTGLAKRQRKLRILLTDHGSRWFPLPRATARLADYYVPVSVGSETTLRSYAPRTACIIPPGVPSAHPLLTLPSLSWEEREIDLIWFGRLVPWKRPDLVLRLARDLGDRLRRPVRLDLLGSTRSADYANWLRSEAGQLGIGRSTRFIFDPDDDTLVDHLRRARLHVLLSSYRDAFGNYNPQPELAPATIIEAAACGTPSVCSNLPALRDQLVPGRTGLALDIDRWPQLVDEILNLFTNTSTWTEMSRDARAFVLAERTYDVLAKRLSDFLGRIRGGLL